MKERKKEEEKVSKGGDRVHGELLWCFSTFQLEWDVKR